jgi:hypothetical protein
METYWCCKNNSIINNYLNPDFNPALVPSTGPACPKWGSGKVVVGVFMSIPINSLKFFTRVMSENPLYLS